MGLIFILPLAALSIFGIVSINRWLRRGNHDARWWRAFRISGCIGIALGLWFTLVLQYHVPKGHIEGFPIPLKFSQEQPDGTVKESRMPAFIHYASLVTDLLCGVAIALVPIRIAGFFKENRLKSHQYPKPGS